MRTTILIFALLLAACNPAETTDEQANSGTDGEPPGEVAAVVRTLDGDSLLVSMDDSDFQVRLLGINAPEGAECHGDVARDALDNRVAGKTVTLVRDQEDADQFDRLLRYVYVDGLNINLALVATGDALALQSGHSMEEDFVSVGDEAYESRLGMWAADACGPRAPNDVEIVGFEHDPSGRDEDNLNGEWVVIGNTGTERVDVGGWILRDESSRHRFVFPSGLALEAGDEIVVRTGCGSDSATELFWCAEDPVWSNGGDTVILQNMAGTVVDRDSFSGDF